jgi:putative flippase GtrA
MLTKVKKVLKTHKQLRYVVSGVLSEIAEYVTFAALLALTNHLLFSNSIGFIVGVASGFVLHKLWSFAGEQQFKTHQQLVSYSVLAGFNFIMSNVLLSALVDGLNIRALIAKLLTMFIIAVWSFVLFNFVIFRHRA